MSISTAIRIAAVLLSLLALADMPYAFYQFLRILVTAAAIREIYSAWSLSENWRTFWTVVFGCVAVIFNPFIPLEMERESWVWFNVLTGCLFAFVFWKDIDPPVRKETRLINGQSVVIHHLSKAESKRRDDERNNRVFATSLSYYTELNGTLPNIKKGLEDFGHLERAINNKLKGIDIDEEAARLSFSLFAGRISATLFLLEPVSPNLNLARNTLIYKDQPIENLYRIAALWAEEITDALDMRLSELRESLSKKEI